MRERTIQHLAGDMLFCHWSGRKISLKSRTQPVKMFACSGTVLDATTNASSLFFPICARHDMRQPCIRMFVDRLLRHEFVNLKSKSSLRVQVSTTFFFNLRIIGGIMCMLNMLGIVGVNPRLRDVWKKLVSVSANLCRNDKLNAEKKRTLALVQAEGRINLRNLNSEQSQPH